MNNETMVELQRGINDRESLICDADVCGIQPIKRWCRFAPDPRAPFMLGPAGPSFEQGIITNVRFYVDNSGCVWGRFSGHAVGDLRLNLTVTDNTLRSGRRLGFNGDHGYFYDADTKQMITKASILFLLPNLKSVYVP